MIPELLEYTARALRHFDHRMRVRRVRKRIENVQRQIRGLPFERGVLLGVEAELLIGADGNETEIPCEPHRSRLEALTATGALACSTCIHNHPSGGSFSFQDLVCTFTWNFREMRAVSNEWIYVVSRPSEGWPVCNGGDAELYKHWIQCRAEALKDLLNQVRTGTITLVEADCEVWHETCKRFLAKFSVAYDRQPSTR